MILPPVTEWFPADVKPVRVGVYERAIDGIPLPHPFYTWNGTAWIGLGSDSPDKMIGRNPSVFQNIQWRGLSSDPSKAKEGE